MIKQGIYLNISRRSYDLPQLIEEYSEQFNLSKADTVAKILRAYPKLLAYKHRVMEQESRSFGRRFLMPSEKNKSAYQDDAYFERERRNILEARNWNKDLMGQTFDQICQDNKNKYRTIRKNLPLFPHQRKRQRLESC